MPDYSRPSDDLEPLRDDPFPDLTAAGDAALRLVAWLIRNKDFGQLEQRTGIRKPEDNQENVIPVLMQLDSHQIVQQLYDDYGVPLAYGKAMKRNGAIRHVTARLPLSADVFRGSVDSLVKAVKDVRTRGVSRVCLGAPGQPSRHPRPSLPDIGLPADRTYNNKVLTGKGAIVGIIDDGCALAHCDFLKPRAAGAPAESRILYLWDQAGTGDTAAGWATPPDFDGLELDKNAIDAALNLPQHKSGDLIREDLVYDYLGYRIGEVSPHGTHVMAIAAGNGESAMGVEGVAPEADIIFVQLPAVAIEGGAPVLWRHILDGAAYIFERAKVLKKPAVVNISYGGYDGPHDGTSNLELAIDQLLAEPDLALVIAAGNGFEARCHAKKTVAKKVQSLRWIVQPQDPTANNLEMWYEDKSQLCVRVRSPGPAIDPAGWIQVGQSCTPITRTSDGKTIGYIEHLKSETGNGANRVVITLNATDAAAGSGTNAPAPSGTWLIELKHQSGPAAEVHAWIWRDDAGHARNARRRQSRFHPDEADPAYTIAGWATGQLTISVGAYNTATQEVCGYSASGPTRPTGNQPGREKPEVYAPAEEDVRGRGVLSASALSANPTRMNGTSASAPHVTGLIALMFEYARTHAQNAPQSLTANQIRTQLKAGSTVAAVKLKFDRHQKVDARVKTKQKDVQNELLASGKTNFTETMKKLPQ